MRTPKSDAIILENLAFEAPLTIYALNKTTGFSTSTIHAAIKKMINKNLVKRGDKGYLATFIGLTSYFLKRFNDETFGQKEMKQIVQRYSSLINHPLFTEHEFLECWLGKDYYDTMLSSALVTKRMLESRFQVVWARATGPIKRGEKVVLLDVKIPIPKEVEEEWLNVFTLWFFTSIVKKSEKLNTPPNNEKIRSLIQKAYEKEISTRKQSLVKLENDMRTLLS